jgi:hypothetical protein
MGPQDIANGMNETGEIHITITSPLFDLTQWSTPTPEVQTTDIDSIDDINDDFETRKNWVEEYFGGDFDRASNAEHEVYELIKSTTGCQMVDNSSLPGSATFSCPSEESYTSMITLLHNAASERPEDDAEIFMALMGHDMYYQ